MNWKRLFWIYFVVSVFHLFVYVLFTCIWRDMDFSMFNLYLLTFITCVVGIVAVVKEEDVPEDGFWIELIEDFFSVGETVFIGDESALYNVYKQKGRKYYLIKV